MIGLPGFQVGVEGKELVGAGAVLVAYLDVAAIGQLHAVEVVGIQTLPVSRVFNDGGVLARSREGVDGDQRFDCDVTGNGQAAIGLDAHQVVVDAIEIIETAQGATGHALGNAVNRRQLVAIR